VIVLGGVGSGLLSKETEDYLPFLVAGMVVWMMLSNTIIEAGSVFTSGAGLIRQMHFEYSTLIFALVWRNLIVLLHNLSVYFAIMLIYMPHALNLKLVWAIPALFLLLLNGVSVALVLGIVTTRFRDMQQLVQSIVSVAMFVTPLFWPPESVTGLRHLVFVTLNPLYYLLSIARDPLLGRTPNASSYFAALVITIFGWAVALNAYRFFRKRLAYWL
jgi:ABC-type polysaccharide/polyol phosphate export permease